MDMDAINLRSDTQTLPTEEMLEAMHHAVLGDDTHDEDPTVQELEHMAAAMMGKEAALLVISGTMGNLVSLMTHARPGDEVILDRESHIFYYECGSLAGVAGLMPMPVPSRGGLMDPEAVEGAIRERNLHFPSPRLLCLENTHNRGGGRVVPLDMHKSLCGIARSHGLAVHLDGARIFNAAVAKGLPPTAFTEDVDSVMFCLSKGLSCPLGSILAGSHDFIERADRARKRIGGGMRQAGIIAAAGIVALKSMVRRLAEDHEHARILAEGIAEIPGLGVDLRSVETNMVLIDFSALGLTTEEAVGRLEKAGVLSSPRPPASIRLVTNRHHTKPIIEKALLRIRAAFA